MINEKPQSEESTDLESVLSKSFSEPLNSRYKTTMFELAHILLPKNPASVSSASFLITFSMIQMLSLMLATPDENVTNYYDVVKYFRLLPLIEDFDSFYVHLCVLYLIAALVIVYWIILVRNYMNPINAKAGILSSLTIYLFWAFMVPVTEIFFSVFNCNTQKKNAITREVTCWTGIHLIYASIIVIPLILWFGIILLLVISSSYSNPFTNDPFSHSQWNFEFAYTILRVVSVIRTMINVGNSGVNTNIASLMDFAISLYFFKVIWNIFPYYHPIVSWIFTGSILSISFIASYHCLIMSLKTLYPIQNSPEILIMLAGTIIVFFLVFIIQRIRYRVVMSATRLLSQKELDLKIYLLTIFYLTKTHLIGVPDEFVNGSLNEYRNKCKDPNCPLMSTAKISSCLSLGKEFSKYTTDITIPQLIIYLLEKGSKERNEQSPIKLGRAYFHLFENVYFAALKVSEVEEKNHEFLVQFSLFGLKMDIQEYLIKIRQKITRRGCGDFYNPLRFEAMSQEFSSTIERSVNIRIEFWNNLGTHPNFNILHTLGMDIMDINKKISSLWDCLMKIYQHNDKLRELYSGYLMAIPGQMEESINVMKAVCYVQDFANEKDFSENKIFSPNSISIVVSHTKASHIKILSVGNNIKKIFGYSSKILTNNPLTILMPRIIGQHHDKLMQEQLPYDMHNSKVNYSKTFGLHRNGYIFPIKVASQQLYSQKYGLLHVGNMEVDSEESGNNYILTDEEGRMEGITQELGELMSISYVMIEEQALFIQYYFPELRNENILDLDGVRKLHFGANSTTAEIEEKGANQEVTSPANHPRKKRPSTVILQSDIKTQFTSKCTVSTKKYCSGTFSLKIFKFPYIKTNTMATSPSLRFSGLIARDCLALGFIKVAKQFINIGRKDKIDPQVKVTETNEICDKIKEEKGECSSEDSESSESSSSSKKEQNPDSHSDESCTNVIRLKFDDDNKANKVDQNDTSNQHNKGNNKVENTTNMNGHFEAASEEQVLKSTTKNETKENNNTVSTKQQFTSNHNHKEDRRRMSALAIKNNITERLCSDASRNNDRDTKAGSIKDVLNVIKNSSYEDFHPFSIKMLKYFLWLFCTLLLLTLCARLLVAIILNKRFETFGIIMTYNSKRISSMGRIGNNVRQLSLYSYNGTKGQVLFNDSLRRSVLDPKLLMPEGWRSDVTTYKDYLNRSAVMASKNLLYELNYILNSIKTFNQSNALLIEPDAIKLNYPSSKNIKSSYNSSMSNALFLVLTYLNEYLDLFRTNANTNQRDFSVFFLVDNILNILIRSTRNGRDGILAEFSQVKDMLNQLSFALMIIMVIVLIMLTIILFPFLQIVNKELDSMLLMLMCIPKPVIKLQLSNAIDYWKILKLEKGFHNEEEAIEKNDAGKVHQIYDSDDGKIDDDNSHNDNEEKALKQTGKSQRTTRILAHINRKNNNWKIMLAFLMFCGVILGIYYGYDFTSNSLTDKILYQINELYTITRGLYFASFNLSYMYHYTFTNRTGNCGTSLCVDYINTRMTERLAEISSLLIYHKRNESLLLPSYRELYRNIYEGNPCATVPHFMNIPQCSTILNGIFTQGLYAAGSRFIIMQKGVKFDVESKIMNSSDIENYINDIRLVQMEVINEVFMIPAFTILAEELAFSGNDMTATNNMVALLFFSFISFFILGPGGYGGKWVLEYLKKSIYDTKSLLSSLPPRVIETNDSIMRYLLKTT